MPAELSLSLLGGLTITLNQQPIAKLPSRKARALLAYLAVTRRAHSRSALAGLFWSDVSEANARMNLRKELTRLRRDLSEFLLIERDTISFRVDSFDADPLVVDADRDGCVNIRSQLDVHLFDTFWDDAHSSDLPVELLTHAVELYQGDFLNGFSVLNAPLFEEWVLLQRNRLRERVIAALQTLASVYRHRANYPQAIDTIRHLLAIEPWREEAHRQLMELLAQNGQRAAALVQYELCVQVLDEELGVEPGTETQDIYALIRDDELEIIPVNPIPVDPITINPIEVTSIPANPEISGQFVLPKHNLPAQATPFIGRKQELAELTCLFALADTRLVTILGPGGMGKTRLALELASTLLGDYEHGVYFVSLAPLSDPALMVSTIVATIGYTFENDDRSPQEELFDYLRPREMLLLLDNIEHLLRDVNLLTKILQAAPRVRLLVTSRERLRLMSETIFPLDGLSLSGGDNDESADAIQLFIQSGQRLRPDFRPTAADWLVLPRICQLVSGMPLGIILAAAWLEMLSVSEIAAEIQQSVEFLSAELYDLPERQRSLHAVFETTWSRLSTLEQNAFKKLAIFQGGFTRDAAQTVADATLKTLAALNHKSLIRRNPNGRYEIHELMRQFALERLAEQTDKVYADHSAYYCTFLQQKEAALKGGGQQVAVIEIKTEGENIRVAWQWIVRAAQVDRQLQSLECLGLFYQWQSRFTEGETMCRLALAQLEMAPSEEVRSSGTEGCQIRSLQAVKLRLGIRAAIWLSRFQTLLTKHELAQQTLKQARDWLAHATLISVATEVEQAQLLLAEAEVIAECERKWKFELIEQSLALFRSDKDHWYTAQGLDLLGRGLRETGQLTASKETIEAGLTIRQNLDDIRGIASSYANLANTVANMGRFEEAIELYRKSIALFAELNDLGQQSYQIFRLAAALVHAGEFNESFQLLEKSNTIHQELGVPTALGMITILSSFALMHLGRYEEAVPLHLDAQSLSGRNTGYALKDMGRTKLVMGHNIEAQNRLEKAVALFRHRGDMNGLGQALGSLGFLALREHKIADARLYIYKNLQIAADTQVYLPSLTALAGIALLRLADHDAKSAVELYELARQHKHVANSKWFEDIAGKSITAASQGLPPAVVDAAQSRGKGRQLAPTIQELWIEVSTQEKVDELFDSSLI